MNSILLINPYKQGNVWVFDDARVGLVREPFVMGASEAIDELTKGIPGAKDGVNLFFSGDRFPGAERFDWVRQESGGNWYFWERLQMSLWLCPALFNYFAVAPESIYAMARELVKN